jgi:hypothetical protein
MNGDDIDLGLRALLAEPERAPDEAFAQRVARHVLAEERLRGARRAAWARFATVMAATASLVMLFVLLARLGSGDSGNVVPPFSPAAAGLLLLALWAAVASAPLGGRPAR